MTAAKGCGLVVLVGLGLLLLGSLGIGLYFGISDQMSKRLSGAQRAQIEKSVQQASERAKVKEAAFRKGMATAGATQGGTGVCDQAPPVEKGALKRQLGLEGANGPDLDEMMKHVRRAQADLGDSNEEILSAAKLADAPSPSLRRFEYRRDRLSRAMTAGTEEAARMVADAAELDAEDFWSWDLVVTVDAKTGVGGVNAEKHTFEGRAAVGRAYLFDYRANAVVCVGEFVATSSDVVRYTESLATPGAAYGAIDEDLRAQILASGRDALRAVKR